VYNTFLNYSYIEKNLKNKKVYSFTPLKKNILGETIKDGNSMLVCFKERINAIKSNIKTWLETSLNELILLDWSSDTSIEEYLKGLGDERVRYVRVKNENNYIRTYAQNLGASMCRYNKLIKVDADTMVKEASLFENHEIKTGEFFVGDFMCSRDENEKATHGLIYLYTSDYFRINGYNEKIKDYGWDDSDFTIRLLLSGLKKKLFNLNFFYHVPHENELRTSNCTRLDPRILVQMNKILCKRDQLWSEKFKRQEFHISRNDWKIDCRRVFSFEYEHDKEERESALKEATSMVFDWTFLGKKKSKEHLRMFETKDHTNMLRLINELTFCNALKSR